jgi:hypothetical protein
MEETKIEVGVEVTLRDGKFFYNIYADDRVSSENIRSILAGAVALSIRGEETPQLQAKALKEVIEYLESEFINVESFTDVKINNKSNK